MLHPLPKNVYSLRLVPTLAITTQASKQGVKMLVLIAQCLMSPTYKHIFYERRLDHESIFSRSGRAMAHDEEQEGHSAVKQNPADSLKSTHLWVVAPRLRPGIGRVGLR